MKFVLLLVSFSWAFAAGADEALWKRVAEGGQVLFLRHEQTTPGVGDPPGFKLEDCATQRNLSDEGRAGARRLGEELKRRRIPVDEVLSSPWCRCLETAKLSVGPGRVWEPLANLYGRHEAAAAQVRALRARIGAYRGKGNLVLVSHGSTALALTGTHPQMGEILVLTPDGGSGFTLAGKLSVPVAPQASPHAIDIPPWFTETLLDLREDVREAASQRRRVMLYFGQDGCPYCKTLMQTNFSQHSLVEKTQRDFVAIALNIWGDREVTWIDGRSFSEKALARALRVQYTPTLLFLDEKGAVALRLNGYYPPPQFAVALDYAAGRAAKGQSFADYMKTAPKGSASPTLHDDALFKQPPVQLRGKKPVALLFETPYCAGCDELHREGLKRAEVRRLLERFDVYRLTLGDRLAGELGIAYTPSVVLFDAGKEAFRIEAYVRPFHLAGALDYVASGAYRKEPSFQRFLQTRAERAAARGTRVELWK